MRRPTVLVLVLVLAALSWLTAASAGAEEAPRIAVVHDGAADPRTLVRLRSELTTLGLRVVEAPIAPDEGASSLDDAARRVDAFAAVRVVPARNGVEVWVADRVTGKTLLRELVVGPGDAADDVVALQAVELLRASLAELGLPSTGRGDVKPAPAVTRLVPVRSPPATARTLVAQVGPAAAVSPGGFGVTGHAFVGLRFRPAQAFGVDAWAFLPVSSSTVEGKEGSAALSPLLIGIDAAWWVLEPARAWQLSLGAGLGLARLGIEGEARPPLPDREDPVTVALAAGRASFGRRFGSRFGVGLDVFLGIAMPELLVRFDGRRVADWGRPLSAVALSFDVGLD